jgi:hypothetical protein
MTKGDIHRIYRNMSAQDQRAFERSESKRGSGICFRSRLHRDGSCGRRRARAG